MCVNDRLGLVLLINEELLLELKSRNTETLSLSDETRAAAKERALDIHNTLLRERERERDGDREQDSERVRMRIQKDFKDSLEVRVGHVGY